MSNKVLRLPAVKSRTGLSRSSIYLHISSGKFPYPINLGERAVGWLEADIEKWIDDRVEASRSTNRKNVGRIEHVKA